MGTFHPYQFRKASATFVFYLDKKKICMYKKNEITFTKLQLTTTTE